MNVATWNAVWLWNQRSFNYSQAQSTQGKIAGSLASHVPTACFPAQTCSGGTRYDQIIIKFSKCSDCSFEKKLLLITILETPVFAPDAFWCSGAGKQRESMNKIHQAHASFLTSTQVKMEASLASISRNHSYPLKPGQSQLRVHASLDFRECD